MNSIATSSILVLEPMKLVQEDIFAILNALAQRCEILHATTLDDAAHLAGEVPNLSLAIVSLSHSIFDASVLDRILQTRACPTVIIDYELSEAFPLGSLRKSIEKPFSESDLVQAIKSLVPIFS